MIKVKSQERGQLAPLFMGLEDSMVIAYLQGYMGVGFADEMPNPKAALIVSAEYCFFAGDATCPGARALAENLFDCTNWDEVVAIYHDDNLAWRDLLMTVQKNQPLEVPRFGIAQRDYDFDLDLLESMSQKIPEGLQLIAFDGALYQQAMAEHWSQAFCDAFDSEADYLNRGFGFAVVDQGKLVAGASTMTVYDGGTETQVATREAYQGRGLALACAAAFVGECVRRGIRPCWDAANETSLHMALKLGYEYRGVYSTVEMHRPIKPGRYRHYKGNEYQVLCIASHSESLEYMVVYQACYGHQGVWVRPASMWNEIVKLKTGEVARFQYIGE